MSTKHLVQTEELKELERAFRKVLADYPLHKKNEGKKYNLKGELAALHAECQIVNQMYKINDFRASCYAYKYTMPKIEQLLDFIVAHPRRTKIKEWCAGSEEFTVAKVKGQEPRKMTNLGYLYDTLRYNQMAIAARYFIEYNIQFLERHKSEKDFPSRKRILESAMWWINQGLLGRFGLKMPFTPKEYDFVPTTVIFSTFPSSGKSYLVNTTNEMFMELNYIINKMGGFLRVGNEQSNIFRQSRQTMAMIEDPDILHIYPENRDFVFKGSYRPFGKSSEEEWGLNGVQFDPATAIFKTRDSAINSVRCKIAAMDDPSRGQQECENVKIHNDILQLYRGDFSDRFKNQQDKFVILTGTMFNPNDVFSVETQEALDGATADTRFKNTYISADKQTVVILNDCEDENGESAYPEFISTKELEKKKKGLSAYTYACVWRQKPIPPEGLIFDYKFLRTFDSISADRLTPYCYAYIDPTRRSARDYFVMPICRYDSETDDYYMVNCICEQKSSTDLVDRVVWDIMTYKIVKLVIEENTDASLAARIIDRLKARGVKYCEVVTIYNTVSKAARIADMAVTVKNSIVFPSRVCTAGNRATSVFMKLLTEYTTNGRNIHDDVPDAICGFAQHIIVNPERRNLVKTEKKLPF